jgi:hypothetical protein
MALLGFKKMFVAPIRKGEKAQTIRGFRKVPIKTGERIFMYTGLRTKHCKKICEAICIGQAWIRIAHNKVAIGAWEKNPKLFLDMRSELNSFAHHDGFTGWEDLKQFWIKEHGKDCFPFKGVIYYFRKVRSIPRPAVKRRLKARAIRMSKSI